MAALSAEVWCSTRHSTSAVLAVDEARSSERAELRTSDCSGDRADRPRVSGGRTSRGGAASGPSSGVVVAPSTAMGRGSSGAVRSVRRCARDSGTLVSPAGACTASSICAASSTDDATGTTHSPPSRCPGQHADDGVAAPTRAAHRPLSGVSATARGDVSLWSRSCARAPTPLQPADTATAARNAASKPA
jgi:hypothetical protein